MKILRTDGQRKRGGLGRERLAVFVPYPAGVVPEIVVVSMFDMHIGQGTIAARFAELDVPRRRIGANSLLDGAAHFRECQFRVVVASYKGDMPVGSAQEVAQYLEKGRMRRLDFSPLLQRDLWRCYAIIKIGANGQKIEAVAIYD